MANRRFGQFFYSTHAMPVLLDCSFTVDSSLAAGTSGLVGPGISAAYMHSSTTSSAPENPAAGNILLKLQDNYYKLFSFDYAIQSPVTGSSINISDSSSLTIGKAYQIVTVGTSSAANWQSAGLPPGLTPAAGMGFLARITGSGTGTGTVKALAPSGVVAMEAVGNPSLMLNPSPSSTGTSYQGGYLAFSMFGATNSSTTTLIPTSPPDGSVVRIRLYLSNSSSAN